MATPRPEPFGCSDHSCVWLPAGRGGMGTNGGCHCIQRTMSPHERMELRARIRWLVEDHARLRALCREAANWLDDLDTASGDTMAIRLRAAGGEL